jgi:hypothetical protein
MSDGWLKLEGLLEKKINFELKLIEFFILTITAEIVIISLSEYKLIIISALLQIFALIWIILLILCDLNKKKTKEDAELLRKYMLVITVPMTWKEIIPIAIYILSIFFMGIIILLPFL